MKKSEEIQSTIKDDAFHDKQEDVMVIARQILKGASDYEIKHDFKETFDIIKKVYKIMKKQ